MLLKFSWIVFNLQNIATETRAELLFRIRIQKDPLKDVLFWPPFMIQVSVQAWFQSVQMLSLAPERSKVCWMTSDHMNRGSSVALALKSKEQHTSVLRQEPQQLQPS